MRCLAIFLVCAFLLAACQPATPPPPFIATTDVELTLAPAQTVTIVDTGLTIRLIGVTSDERCPSEIECAMSGPVSISLSAQMGDAGPVDVTMQTLTDYDGRSPSMKFEGIESRATYGGYLIQVVGVLPYPRKSTSEIKDSDYRVTLVVVRE